MPKPRTKYQAPPSTRLYTYTLPEGWQIIAGRTDADNDQLSLRIARPNDWWFHVRGMPGSHVILQVQGNMEPPKAVLQQAAAVAAYHSKARAGGTVAVSATRAKFVRKPKGAKPGTVQIRKESIIKVRPALPPGSSAIDTPG